MAKSPDWNQAALVEHLTKEIEVATSLLAEQRTKNNLMVALGPFAILGALVLSEDGMSVFNRASNGRMVAMAAAFIAAYGALGFMSARVELKIWNQCNAWRDLVAELTGQPPEKLRFPASGLTASYIGIYLSIAVFVSVSVWILRTPN